MKFKVTYKSAPLHKIWVHKVEYVEADDYYTDHGFIAFRNQGTMQAVKMISCDNVLKVDLIDG